MEETDSFVRGIDMAEFTDEVTVNVGEVEVKCPICGGHGQICVAVGYHTERDSYMKGAIDYSTLETFGFSKEDPFHGKSCWKCFLCKGEGTITVDVGEIESEVTMNIEPSDWH